MGRSKASDIEENNILARACISAIEDSIAGADQKAKMFFEIMYCRFIEKGPSVEALVEGKYGFRASGICCTHVAELSADTQKLASAFRKVRSCNPTGVSEEDILSTAVAIQMGKSRTMDYEMKGYCKENWLGYKAWLAFRRYAKWAISETGDQENLSSTRPEWQSQQLSAPTPLSAASYGLEEETTQKDSVRQGAASNSGVRPIGSCKDNFVREEELRTQALLRMAESAKRKS